MNVILIISDTVRQDYCGCYGNRWVQTPSIDALSRESTVMDNAFTASFPTGPMRKDVHTGRFTFAYTGWGAGRLEGEEVLSEILCANGVRTAYVGDTCNSFQLAARFDVEGRVAGDPSRLETVPTDVPLPADARKLRTPLDRLQRIMRRAQAWDGEADRRAARTMAAAHRWLEDQCRSDQPFFLWVDTFDPHEPWDPPRYYIDQYDPNYTGDELIEPAYAPADYATPDEIKHMRSMYAAKLTMVDRWIGFLLDGVKRMGLADNTAIVFTSDHGFYHGEHGLIGKLHLSPDGQFFRRWPLYRTIAHVPLMIKLPDVAGGNRTDAFCQPPDVMPTVMDLLGVRVGPRVQGQSLVPLVRGDIDRIRDVAVSALTHITDADVRAPASLRTHDHLYVYGGDEWDTELYDLRADPDEMHNIIDAHEDVARHLHARYLAFLEEIDCPLLSLEARRPFRPSRRTPLPPHAIVL